MVIYLNPKAWIVSKPNPELQWLFSLIGDDQWHVVAYRRLYQPDAPSDMGCYHQEVAWLWVHPSLPESLLYDTDKEDIGGVDELTHAKLLPIEHVVDILISDSDWIVLRDEPTAPPWVLPIVDALQQRLLKRENYLRRELRLAQPGSEQEHVLSQQLDRIINIPFTSIDVRNRACDQCDPIDQ